MLVLDDVVWASCGNSVVTVDVSSLATQVRPSLPETQAELQFNVTKGKDFHQVPPAFERNPGVLF